jgi:hypothetical protein
VTRQELHRDNVTHIRYAPIVVRRQVGQLPTPWKLTLTDGRERRVYVLQYANGGATPYVLIAGVTHYLSPWLEGDLERHLSDIEHLAMPEVDALISDYRIGGAL